MLEIGGESVENFKVTKNDAQGVQVEWRGVLLTLQINAHHGISGSIAESVGDKVLLLCFHGAHPKRPMPLTFHEDSMKSGSKD